MVVLVVEDVALIDIDLEVPGAGIGVAHQLSKLHGTAIVFTTGQVDAARKHSDIAAAVLVKPYDPADLAGVVQSATLRPRAASRVTPSRSASFTGFPLHNGSGA